VARWPQSRRDCSIFSCKSAAESLPPGFLLSLLLPGSMSSHSAAEKKFVVNRFPRRAAEGRSYSCVYGDKQIRLRLIRHSSPFVERNVIVAVAREDYFRAQPAFQS